jgi:predicted ThiF/HesA family dinucleotide-utilizing enzyme
MNKTTMSLPPKTQSVFVPPVQQRLPLSGGNEVSGMKPLNIQRLASHDRHQQPEIPEIVHEVLGSQGQPLDQDTRKFMEHRFDADFSRVRVHSDGRAAESARKINALAYTAGCDVVLGSARYMQKNNPLNPVLAHELAHVVQQNSGSLMPENLSSPGDTAEQRADLAANAIMQNRPIPDVGNAPPATLFRLVSTNGGDFDTTRYQAVNDNSGADAAGVGKRVGATINLNFTPNTLVVADNIGLTQTVNTQASTVAGGPVNTPNPASPRKGSISLTAAEGEEGRAIDQGDPGDADTIPNTNPLYNVENTPGNVSATLTDVPADPAFGDHAFRKRNATGGFDVHAGTLGDSPRRRINFAGQQFNQKFEVTALVLDGPMANTYLGSIEWGWRSDAAHNASLDPDPIRMVSAGAPTTAFMDAARKWNAATFTDPTTSTVHNTVDLPILNDDLNSGMTRAADRTTANLIAWINMVNFQLSNMAAGADRTNKEFEKRALEAELRTRSLQATVRVVSTTSGPGRDDVYMKVSRGRRSVRTRVRMMGDGQTGTFSVPLENLVPIDGPITIEFFDEDRVSADDLIVRMSWASPFGDELRNTESLDGADYRVVVRFNR